MSEIVRFVALTSCILWALSSRPPSIVQWFLYAQLAATAALEPFVLLGQTSGTAYLIAWTVLTPLATLSALFLTIFYVWMHPRARLVWGLGLMLSGAFTMFAYRALPHATIGDRINLTFGAVTLLMAVVLGLAARKLTEAPRPAGLIAITLSMLFFAEAGWDLGWPMLQRMGDWDLLNTWFKAFAVSTAFSWLAIKLREYRTT